MTEAKSKSNTESKQKTTSTTNLTAKLHGRKHLYGKVTKMKEIACTRIHTTGQKLNGKARSLILNTSSCFSATF